MGMAGCSGERGTLPLILPSALATKPSRLRDIVGAALARVVAVQNKLPMVVKPLAA